MISSIIYLLKTTWIYLLAALTFVILLPKLKHKLQNSEEFYGIAENQIRTYSRANDVIIQSIKVRLGQSVTAGDTLMIFHPKSLFYKKEDLASQARLLDINRQAGRFEIGQSLLQAQQQKNLIQEGYKSKKAKLMNQKKMTDSLSRLVTSIPIANTKIDLELQTLDELMAIELMDLDIRSRSLEQELSKAPDPTQEKQFNIHTEVNRITEQERDLVLVADTDGMIGQLDFQIGDPVAAYQSLIKIYSIHPTLVTSYIGEGYLGKVTLMDSVSIQSISETNYQLKGKILNLGSRITALPDRLKKNPELKAWGREVQIEIPANNRLIQGEKVKIIFQSK